MLGPTPHLILDGFLSDNIAARLLDEIVAAAARFVPSLVGGSRSGTTVPSIRSSLRLPGRVSVDLLPFKAAIAANSEELCAAVGIEPFAVDHTECSIVAHGDGHYYRTHVDTPLGGETVQLKHFRLVSCVYYLFRAPQGFKGGALNIHSLNLPNEEKAAIAIEPRHNRLVVFPSFIPHEVQNIVCPSGKFADFRFSINCWLHKARSKNFC